MSRQIIAIVVAVTMGIWLGAVGWAEPHGRRLILNDDSTGQTISYKAPVRKSDLYAMVDKVAGTGVTTLSVAQYDGYNVWHNSRVADHIADHPGAGDIQSFYRIVSVCRNMREQGIDPMQVYVERAHEKGLEFFACLRMNDAHNTARYSSNFRENPDLHLDGQRYNYAKEGTRQFRLAQIEEVCRNYDIDGFEMDFMRTPYYLDNPKEQMNLMTQFVRDVRRMMIEVGREKKRKILLLATVPRTIAECELIGLDVRAWVREGVIDLLAAKNFIWFEQDLPVKEWSTLVIGSGVEFYAGFEHGDTLETFRAGAAKYYRDGAKGMYIYNFWSFDLPYNALGRQILTELAGPQLLEGQDKHYALLGGGPCKIGGGDRQRPTGQVPATVAANGSKRFQIDVADDMVGALNSGNLKDVTLRIVTNADKPDLELALNGVPIDEALLTSSDKTCEVVMTRPNMHAGINTLKVVANNSGDVNVTSVETLIRFRGSRPPVSPPLVVGGMATGRDSRYAAEEGPWKSLASKFSSPPLILAHRGQPGKSQEVRATVTIESADALASSEFVRFELRTPRDNAAPHEPNPGWRRIYGGQPWETDRYEIKINGHVVPKSQLIPRISSNKHEYWQWGVRFDAPAELLRADDNLLEMRITYREPDIAWGLIFVRLDLFSR